MTEVAKHLLVDAEACPADRVGSASVVRDALLAVVDALSLTMVAPPEVHQSADVIAGIVLISESHVSIHALPNERRIHADIFSCRDFDADAAVDVLRVAFAFERWDARIVERGIGTSA